MRIGYLSADLHDHATMHLLAGVLQAHDRSRHAIHIYSYGPDIQDSYRKLAMENCEAFHDLRTLSDHAAARQIADDGIDILVDLKGYTRDSRLGISALRPAPVIVSWLGYPGTLGHERLADYIIGDPVVTPLDATDGYSEMLALMPHCYQPNDRNRQISVAPPRATERLPEDANRPAPGVPFSRTCSVAATKSAAEPPCFTRRKHFTASTRSLVWEEATNPTFGALLRRNPAV